jgi:hypothetical protein
MAIAKLSIDLDAKLAGLQAGLDKAGFLAEKSAQRIDKAFSGLTGKIAGGNVLANLATDLGRRLATFVPEVLRGLDALNDLSDATGASVENLSALEDIAVRTGTSMATVGDAIIKMNKALSDAKPGSDQAAAFDALGLSIKELKALDPVLAFQKLAIALQGYANDGNKARLVQELFGKSLKDVAPLLKDAAEAGELYGTVTREQAEAAEAFRKQIFALQKDIVDLTRSALAPMLEAFTQVSGAFKSTNQYAGELTGTAKALAVPLQALAVFGANVAYVFQQTGQEIGALLAQAEALGRGDINTFKAIRELRLADAAEARKRIDELDARLLNLDGKANDALRRAEDRGFTPAKGSAPAIPDRATLKKIADARLKLAIESAQALVDLEEITAQETAEAWSYVNKSVLANYEDRRAAAELQNKQVLDFIDQQKQGSIDMGAAFLDAVKDTKGVGEELALVFSSAASNAITNFENLRGVLNGILQDIAQIAIRETITKPLSGFITDALKGFSFASLLGSANGNAFGPGGVMAFANGGVVNQPTMFQFPGGTGVMGEAGPEAVMPLKRGRDGKLGVSGGVSMTYAPTINIDSRTDQAQVGQIVAAAVQQGQRQMLQHLKAQGALA